MKLTLILALLAAPAETAPRPCITRAQLEDLTVFMLPPVIEALATKCRPSLPAQAYLLNGGKTLAAGLAAQGAGRWSATSAAVAAVAGDKLPDGLSEETARGLMRDMAAGEIKLKAEDCVRIDRMAELLAPLPPQNLVAMVGLVGEIVLKDEGKKKGPAICPAAAP